MQARGPAPRAQRLTTSASALRSALWQVAGMIRPGVRRIRLASPVLALGLVLSAAGCGETVDRDGGPAAAQQPAGRVRVMPLGDSITEGFRNEVTWRWFLWQQLLDAGYEVDFVGSQRGAYRGPPKLRDFDQDHEGHWGWRADGVAARVEGWARAARPDVVLLHLGTNDVASRQSARSTKDDLRRIVGRLRRVNRDVTVLLAQVIPLARRESVILALNREIAALAREASTARSPVVLVDQFSRFDVRRLSDDGIHPNTIGEARMADRWYAALAPVLEAKAEPKD